MSNRKYLIALNDEDSGKDRIIFVTSWGTSPWKVHAKPFNKKEANKILKEIITNKKWETTSGYLIEQNETYTK